jgi:hypothetical protein
MRLGIADSRTKGNLYKLKKWYLEIADDRRYICRSGQYLQLTSPRLVRYSRQQATVSQLTLDRDTGCRITQIPNCAC